MKNTLLRTLLIIATFAMLLISIKVLSTSIHLWSISDSINYLENNTSWNAEDKALYNEMKGDRISIKESSVIGKLMVEAGSNWYSDLLRIFAIIGALLAVPTILCLYFNMIRDAKQRYEKIKTGKAKRQYRKSLSKKFR